jgi:hypothetical protein
MSILHVFHYSKGLVFGVSVFGWELCMAVVERAMVGLTGWLVGCGKAFVAGLVAVFSFLSFRFSSHPSAISFEICVMCCIYLS